MHVVSLRTSQLLKAAGYPQDQWPQMVWSSWESVDDPDWSVEYAEEPEEVSYGDIWLAAPDPLSALEWLRTTKGWAISLFLGAGGYTNGDIFADDEYGGEVLADTVDALIIAICDRITAKEEQPA